MERRRAMGVIIRCGRPPLASLHFFARVFNLFIRVRIVAPRGKS